MTKKSSMKNFISQLSWIFSEHNQHYIIMWHKWLFPNWPYFHKKWERTARTPTTEQSHSYTFNDDKMLQWSTSNFLDDLESEQDRHSQQSTMMDEKLILIHGDTLHPNDGCHLQSGIVDDELWKCHLPTFTIQSTQLGNCYIVCFHCCC